MILNWIARGVILGLRVFAYLFFCWLYPREARAGLKEFLKLGWKAARKKYLNEKENL